MPGRDFGRGLDPISTRQETFTFSRSHTPQPRPWDHPGFQPPTTPLTPLMHPDVSPPAPGETGSDTGPGRWRRLAARYGRDAVGVAALGVYAWAVATTPAEERLFSACRQAGFVVSLYGLGCAASRAWGKTRAWLVARNTAPAELARLPQTTPGR